MAIWLLIIWFSELSACTCQTNLETTQYTSGIQDDTIKYVIFKPKKISDSIKMTPVHLSKTDINQIRLLLKKAIEEYNNDSKKFQAIQPLDRYKMQFIPFLNSKNEKEVWVNCFCNDLSELGINWRKKIINVFDGGSCFFILKINLTLNISYDLYINGVA